MGKSYFSLTCMKHLSYVSINTLIRQNLSAALNRACDDNPLDPFIRQDVRAIFKSNFKPIIHGLCKYIYEKNIVKTDMYV